MRGKAGCLCDYPLKYFPSGFRSVWRGDRVRIGYPRNFLIEVRGLSCGTIELDSRRARGANKSSVQRPEPAVRKQCGSQKMRIDPADAQAPKLPIFNQSHHLPMRGRKRRGKSLEIAQNARSILQIATGQFTQDEGMHHDQGFAQKRSEPRTAFPEVRDPDRSINKDHRVAPDRRLGIERNRGSLPARAAKRRAASRAIRASRPACTNAVFFRIPVSCRARSKRSGSMISVVLICMSMHELCR